MLIFPDVTILLSLTVFLNTVSESMPATSDAVPLISMSGLRNIAEATFLLLNQASITVAIDASSLVLLLLYYLLIHTVESKPFCR